MIRIKIFLVVCLLLQFTIPFSWAKVTFHAHFDGPTAAADYGLGSTRAKPAIAGGYRLAASCADGRFRRGLDLRKPTANCVFDGSKNFNPRRGTVEFWFRIDEHKKGMYHPLFGWYRPPHQPGRRKRLSGIEVYFHNSSMILAIHSKKYKSYTRPAPYRLKTWYHCEIHWDCSRGSGSSVYSISLDGKRIIYVQDGEPLNGSGGQIHLGIWDYGFGHCLRGVIDELRITDQVEHPVQFRPNTIPYAIPRTPGYARETHRVAAQRLEALRAEVSALTKLAGARGRRPTTLVIRRGRELANRAAQSLSSVSRLLKENQSSIKDICQKVDLALELINEGRFAIRRVTARSESLAAAEDKRSLLFKDLDGQLLGDAILLQGKQLFIDDFIIKKMHGCKRLLHQPVKHPRNPLVVADKPWEKTMLNRGSVIFDRRNKQFKMWYVTYTKDLKEQLLCYATSSDGIRWKKPVINRRNNSNIIPKLRAANPPNVYYDDRDSNPNRRYKMLYGKGRAGNYTTNVAFSRNGIDWLPARTNPVIPHSDTLNSVVWDPRRRCYVAFVRYGPPNIRAISRVESKDFVRWSPKVTVLGRHPMDGPFATTLYGMRVMRYAQTYLGFISTYHGETIRPIPPNRMWMDRTNVQLAFSRNGVNWQRVGASGAISNRNSKRAKTNWRQVAQSATFLPYGKSKSDWDWGQIYPFEAPLVVGNKIWFYYQGLKGRHWFKHHGDPTTSGIGLATLRLDGFLSIAAEQSGVLETKPFVAIGDTLVVNAKTKGKGSIHVEAIDALGRVIKGFSKSKCLAITGDNVQHVVTWNSVANCHALQARPIQLRFHLRQAQIYSFEFQIRHNHFVPNSYRQ